METWKAGETSSNQVLPSLLQRRWRRGCGATNRNRWDPPADPQKTIRIQIETASFVDEGVDKVLDILPERGQSRSVYDMTKPIETRISAPELF